MDELLAKLLAAIPSGRTVAIKDLIRALNELPGNKAARIEIDQQGSQWLLVINLSDLSQ
jgi:hypothetical protein